MSDQVEFDARWDGASIPKEHWHFHRRLLERYGIALAPGEFSKIAISIRKQRAHLVETGKNRTAVYCVKVDSAGIYVFVGTNHGQMVTILPPSDKLKRKTLASIMRLRAKQSPAAH